jgi:hypothetical protein
MAFMTNRTSLYAFLAFAIAFTVSLLAQAPYVFNAFLIQDDTIFISRAWFGAASIPPTHPFIYWLLKLATPYTSVAAIKVASMAFIGGIAAVSCLWLILFRVPPLGAAAIGSTIALYPVAIDQGLFVTGSHPTIGSVFLILAAYSICATWTGPMRQALLGAVAACIFGVLARLTSPSLFLGVAVPLIMTIGCWVAYKSPKEQALRVALVCLAPLFLSYFYGLNYHYSHIVGWTDFSATRVLQNFDIALERALRPPVLLGASVLVVVLAAAVVIVAAVARHWTTHRDNIVFGACLLLCAALAFGTSSVTTSYLDRYLVAPVTLALLAGATIAGPSFANLGRAWRSACLIAGALIVGITVTAVTFERKKVFGSQLVAHDAISRLVSASAATWPRNAQVVIALYPGLAPPTSGYNHWSTWYARYLANRQDIIALIGNVKSLDKSPFVESYADHSPAYWQVENGRSRRIPMRGLEYGRPLLAYELHRTNPASDLCPVEVVFKASETWIVGPATKISDGSTAGNPKNDNLRSTIAGCRDVKPKQLIWTIDEPSLAKTKSYVSQ